MTAMSVRFNLLVVLLLFAQVSTIEYTLDYEFILLNFIEKVISRESQAGHVEKPDCTLFHGTETTETEPMALLVKSSGALPAMCGSVSGSTIFGQKQQESRTRCCGSTGKSNDWNPWLGDPAVPAVRYDKSVEIDECTNTGVITVTNPDPSIYIWARINSSDFICPNNMTDGKIIIYDCFDRDLTLLLSDEVGMPNIIKDVHKTFTLACIAIPNEGIFQTVQDKTHIAVQQVESAIAPAQFPDLDLDTSVVDPVTGEAKVEAIIGQPFNWTIVGPDEYKIKPLRCTASGGIFSVDTHVDRCTLDGSIMSDFDHIDATQTSVVATVYTFRFPGSNQLELSCTMLACPSTSIACEFNCTGARRKRSEEDFTIVQSDIVIATDGGPTEIRTTAEISSQINLHRHRRRTSSDLETSVTTSVRVIGEPNMFVHGYFSGSMSTLKSTNNPIVLLISLICFYGCILLLDRVYQSVFCLT